MLAQLSSLSLTLALLAAVSNVSAHTIMQQIYVNGASPGHEVAVRYPTYDGPITDVTSDDLICNGGPNPLVTPYSQVIQDTPAGSTFITEFHHTLAGYDPTDSADPIDPSHLGPVMIYMAAVPSALQTDVTGLGWFKIYEYGLTGTTWGTQVMIANKGNITFTIPSCIPNGNYFLRAEALALHAASTYPGAQFYMECAQINITGGGSTLPATVSFPGAYQPTDPGITIDIYYPTVTDYIVPGPPVFTCGGGGGSPPPASTTTKASSTTTHATTSSTTVHTTTSTTTVHTTTTTTTTPHTTTATTSASSGGNGTTVAKYGQCGGIGWTGGTVCAAGSTCQVSNPYYSQCL